VRSLDDFLPVYEFSERHGIGIRASADRIEHGLRSVALVDLPLARLLWWLRSLGRPRGDPSTPLVRALPGVVLEDSAGEGIVLGLTGQFWRLRGNLDGGPATAEEFLADARPDFCKAVIDFRIGDAQLSTETRVHVADPAARRKFRRYWLVIRPFSGLIRILLLRAARRRAEAAP
jgi:hypothetical protein